MGFGKIEPYLERVRFTEIESERTNGVRQKDQVRYEIEVWSAGGFSP